MTDVMGDLMNGDQSILDSQKQRQMEADLQMQQMAQVTASSLSEVAPETGDMTEGDIILPVDGSTSTVPTDSGFTGPFLSRNGFSFGNVIYQFGAVLAGVLGVGFNNQGQLVWGAGNVFADKLGLLFAVPGTFINFAYKALINAVYISSAYLMALKLEAYDQNGTDVITNGTAETGNTTGWTLAGTAPVASTAEAHSGTYSFKLTDATSAMLQTVGSFSGKHPVIPFWYKGGAVQASLEILDAASLQLGVITLYFPAASVWVPQSIAIVNDFPTADKAKISFQGLSATPVYVDDIKMLKLDSYAAIDIGAARSTFNDAIRLRAIKVIMGNGSASANDALLDVRGDTYLGGDAKITGLLTANHPGVTGVIDGGELSINADPTKIDIAAGYGIRYDWTDPANPVPEIITWNAQTGVAIPTLAYGFTRVEVTGNNTILLTSGVVPTDSSRIDNIQLGEAIHQNGTSVTGFGEDRKLAYQSVEQLINWVYQYGPQNTGNNPLAASTNLQVQKLAGTTRQPYSNSNADPQNPWYSVNAALSPIYMSYTYATGGGNYTTGAPTLNVDPNNYNNGTTLTAIGAGNKFTNQYFFYFARFNFYVVSYGQTIYTSIAEAQAAISTESPDIGPFARQGALVAILIVKQGTTDLSDSTKAVFIRRTGTVGGVTTVPTMQAVYTNSSDPEITTNSTNGALSIRGGTGSDTAKNFDIKNNAGTETFYILANGKVVLSNVIDEYKGANIASSSTTDIGAATGNYVNVTGTTTITALGTVQAGTRRIVQFTGALTLTYNATSLILPGAANITTTAGDVAEFVSEGSGNWRCTRYTRTSAPPVSGTNTGDETTATIASKSIDDAITNGVINKAPSQNAVFDALALKPNYTPVGGSGANNTIAASTTAYLGFFYTGAPGTVLADQTWNIHYPGTLQLWAWRTRSAQPASGSLVFTVQIGGVDTAITATVSAGAAAGLFTDLTHTAAVVSGNGLTNKIVNNATGTSAQIGQFSGTIGA